MLAGSITPRPRPPARSRRTSSHVKSSPPPPYRLSLPDDPLIQSEKLSPNSLRADWNRLSFPAQSDPWNERSREELSDLLHKADELIKDREMELNATTVVCKSLYENNLELKSRHKALLARFPHSPASSSPALSSSSPSPISPDAPLPQSPHYYSGDESRNSSKASLRSSRTQPRHHRVSVSPADLALLSDQNAELLAKIEKLEAESMQADQAGRRKLRSLEKEIQGLRDELENTRARSDELERKAKVASEAAQKDEETERRKREREERLRPLRGKTEPEMVEPEIRDFAPGSALSTPGSLFAPSKARFTSRRRHISEAFIRPKLSELNISEDRQRRVSFQSPLPRSASHQEFLLPSPLSLSAASTYEHTLVSQLLQKITELEDTNAQITEQQARTVVQLQAVQEDAASLRLVYESLGDGEGVEWLADDDRPSPNIGADEADETIRFASLRRTLSAEAASLEFDRGIDEAMQSSLRQEVVPDHVPVSAHAKARRSVVGLFDLPQGEIASPSSPHSESAPSVLEMMIPGLPPVPFVPQPSNTSTSASPIPSRSPSPILSPSLTGAATPVGVEDPFLLPTLQSELGAAFDGRWDGGEGHDDSPSNIHFRTPSIVSLTSIISGSVDISSPLTQSQSAPGGSGLQPGPWNGDQSRSLSDLPDSKPDTPIEKKRRKSQTIRMRAAHWNEGRFDRTLLGSEKRHSIDINRPSTPVPERLASAFEAIVDTMSRNKGESDASSYDLRGDNASSAESSMVVVRSGRTVVATRPAGPPAPRQRGIVAFVLEIWLWLQFAIIVIVFVWAMAKRGPKSVLEEARRKRA